jgi:hypothetical protein
VAVAVAVVVAIIPKAVVLELEDRALMLVHW